MKKSTQLEIIKRVYNTVKKLKEGSINTIANEAKLSWHATNRALKIMEVLNIIREDKEKSHKQQRYYKLIGK